MTSEEQLIQRYFDAFNRHDLEPVVACFHDQAVLVGTNGKRLVGLAEVRRSYETEFALFPPMPTASCASAPVIAAAEWPNPSFRERAPDMEGSRRSARK